MTMLTMMMMMFSHDDVPLAPVNPWEPVSPGGPVAPELPTHTIQCRTPLLRSTCIRLVIDLSFADKVRF